MSEWMNERSKPNQNKYEEVKEQERKLVFVISNAEETIKVMKNARFFLSFPYFFSIIKLSTQPDVVLKRNESKLKRNNVACLKYIIYVQKKIYKWMKDLFTNDVDEKCSRLWRWWCWWSPQSFHVPLKWKFKCLNVRHTKKSFCLIFSFVRRKEKIWYLQLSTIL